ncbi:MAG: hypothetical protein N3I35_15300 [Clostridia bacterium]|nr:hypothetical protein [Clostridia bacterium]
MKRNYIGLATSFRDPSITIVNSKGEVVFAEASERYVQYKRAAQMSPDQFGYYLYHLLKTHTEAGAELVVAHSWSDRAAESIEKNLKHATEASAKLSNENSEDALVLKKYYDDQKYMSYHAIESIKNASKNLEAMVSMLDGFNLVSVRRYDHHLTHAATACYSSPFKEAACAVLDGYGETRAYNCYHYQDGKILQLPGLVDHEFFKSSLGMFYELVCDACGFDPAAGEEWKVMGLAAYGQFDQEIYDFFKSGLTVNGLNLEQCPDDSFAAYLVRFSKMKRRKEEPAIKAANLAYNGQLVFTEILFKYLNNLYNLGLSENLIMGGGCCLNSSANGQITAKTGFKNVHIPSAPGDDGNSVGAALLAYYEDHPEKKREPKVQSPYLGSELEFYKVARLKKFSGFSKISHYPGEVHKETAKRLAEGKIVGWVQGKAEFGPRALGNRSILADARSPRIKDIINERVKFREEFRPLAPSIIHEFGAEFFENYQESPYMERTLKFREGVKHKVPGVVHEDGTGRLQTVKKEWNEKYYDLIYAFYELTDIPLILNTSFNVMGKPIIHSVEDAVAVFCTSGLDVLVIGDLLIEKD